MLIGIYVVYLLLSYHSPEDFDGKKDHQGHEGHDLCANNKKEGRFWQHYDLCRVGKLRKITMTFLKKFREINFSIKLFTWHIELISRNIFM